MFKRLTAALLCLLLFLATGCNKAPEDTSSVAEVSSEVESQAEEFYTNPLTGVKDVKEGKQNSRPVAIMINNIKPAQKVQTGLDGADIVYETEVEGGITRLLAVYKDVSKMGKIGTVRSARYAYIDLAMGHNAIFIHNGSDPSYARPHLSDAVHIDLGSKSYGKRISNGLASEHTYYTDGTTLSDGITKEKIKNTLESEKAWQSFADEDEVVTLTGGTAVEAVVKFSSSYVSTFKYDAASGRYTRYSGTSAPTDYFERNTTTVKNVFVLTTSITNYADGKHRNVNLTSGTGYYVTNGTYTPILWNKGSATSPLKFTNADGSALTVAAGDSWVCIAGNQFAPSFQ